MAAFPGMRQLFGRVAAVRGVDAVVGLGDDGDVRLAVASRSDGVVWQEHGYSAADAHRLAERLDAAADVVENRSSSTERPTRSDPRFEIRAQWPTVAVSLCDPPGVPWPGVDLTPAAARRLAQLLRRAGYADARRALPAARTPSRATYERLAKLRIGAVEPNPECRSQDRPQHRADRTP